MTSNLGSRDIKVTGDLVSAQIRRKINTKQLKSSIEDAMKRVFNPEFLNRVDDTLIFHHLNAPIFIKL